MTGGRVQGLDELAFEGRNKSYGAYYLRKNYHRFLLVSFITGTFIVVLTVFIFWLYYSFEDIPLVEGEMIYEVEYYNLNPLPDYEVNKVAQAFSKPEKEIEQAPVVTDSIKPEEPKKVVEPPVEKHEDVETNTDSAAKPGSSGLGKGIGDETGLNTAIDVYPRYPGGDESRLYYLRKNVRYPEAALKSNVQGVVMVVFVVEVDGSITNVDAARRIGEGCDEEAIRVTKEMPRWEPGKRNGRAVRVMVRMPIVFRIPGKAATGN
ncbi:MAG: TonB family protein [Bacteroidales bacterium]|nr:TonB family protein [Bacteroidales bacterium]